MICPHIPKITYPEFSRHAFKDMTKKRVPILGMFELTWRCNIKCRHCYIRQEEGDGELSYNEIINILDQLADAGCLWLCFTGGEPLFRPDFKEIYMAAKKKGFLVTIFTNGTLIIDEIVDILREYKPYYVEITILGATKETHENITRVPGSFERCVRGIHLLLENEIPLRLKTMLMSLNKHEIWKIKRWVKEDLGLNFKFDPILNRRLDGDGIESIEGLRLSPQEIVKLDLYDEDRKKEWLKFWKRFKGSPRSDNLYICGAGINSFVIDAYGRLSMCVLSREPNYNLRKGRFKEGWYNVFPLVGRRKITHDYKCRHCDLIAICGQCPGWAALENSNPETPVNYLCEIAHARAEALALRKY